MEWNCKSHYLSLSADLGDEENFIFISCSLQAKIYPIDFLETKWIAFELYKLSKIFTERRRKKFMFIFQINCSTHVTSYFLHIVSKFPAKLATSWRGHETLGSHLNRITQYVGSLGLRLHTRVQHCYFTAKLGGGLQYTSVEASLSIVLWPILHFGPRPG